MVRPATLADLPHILAVERECDTAPHWAEAEYRRILLGESPVPRCVLVTAEGFAVASVIAGIAELESIAVVPAARRQGIGRALCRAVLRWCRFQSASAVELEVRAASLGARNLYLQLGFVETGHRPRYYKTPVDDAVLMRLELPSDTAPQRIITPIW